MLFRNLFIKYYAAAGEGGGDGGGNGGGNEPEITPELQAIIDARVNDSVTGLQNKNNELLGKLRKANDTLKTFDGIDPDSVRSILQRFSDDEEAKLIADGKLDVVLEKRTERMRTDAEKQIKTANERAGQAEAFANKFRDRVLNDAVREAGVKAGVLPTATDDLILRARSTFRIDEEGNAVAADADGNAILGKDGKTPLSPVEWAESLKDSAPHLFPQAEGTGAGAHKGGGSNAGLKRSEMSSAQKSEFLQKHGQQAYLRLPK
ncbi:hypothetical protein ERD95_15755 [Enterobacteriaceae bacterium ML5]|nr:hypothetical protein ERD95_15755 [Enterobacteriaceae bacterium ML5]